MNYFLVALTNAVANKKPIVPVLVHDESTRLMIIIPSLLVVSYILYRTMIYYGR